MNSLKLIKAGSRSLTLTIAVFMLGSAGAQAAHADAESQARQLLARTIPTHAHAGALSTGSRDGRFLDAQDQARRLILGPGSVAKSSGAEADHRRAYVDAQVLARRMILGGTG